jgi:hypothetical protein
VAILWTVKRLVKRVLAALERRLFSQLLGRMDALETHVSTRLDAFERRLNEVQAAAESSAARSAATIEYAHGTAETEARVTRRVEDIERLLGATTPGTP